MTTKADGTGVCDRCGRDLPNTGVQYSVVLVGMLETGEPWTGNICTMNPDPCSSAVFTEDVFSKAEMPDFYHEVPVNE